MAMTTSPALVMRGAIGAFHQKLGSIPSVWQNHVMRVPSSGAKEIYAFPGMIPEPRLLLDGRSIQGMRDFTFDVTNNTYELTMLIKTEDFEDDQVNGIKMRLQEIAEVFATYKDKIFAALLEDNDAPPIADSDEVTWATFYETAAAGIIGGSGGITNDYSDAAATGTLPTLGELQAQWVILKAAMWKVKDDQARPVFNATAMSNLRCVIPAEYEYVFRQLFNASFTVDPVTATGSGENVIRGDAGFDILPYLANTDAFYVNALGSERKPFIYQERIPLKLTVDTSEEGMQREGGVLVMARERWVMTYGDPRRSARQVWT